MIFVQLILMKWQVITFEQILQWKGNCYLFFKIIAIYIYVHDSFRRKTYL